MKKKRILTWLRQYKDFACPLSVIVLFYVILHFTGVGCPIKFLTGVSCLGCGMTRAWISVLKLDFSAAFYYHPLFMLPPAALAVYLIKSKISIKIYKIFMLTACIAFITIYLYRLICADGDVVVFEPENNIVFRLFRALKRMEGD